MVMVKLYLNSLPKEVFFQTMRLLKASGINTNDKLYSKILPLGSSARCFELIYHRPNCKALKNDPIWCLVYTIWILVEL